MEQLASQACRSPRTFARQFRATHGTTPYRWLLQQRLLLARQFLETTEQPVALVAEQAGFGTAAALRVHFKRSVSAVSFDLATRVPEDLCRRLMRRRSAPRSGSSDV